MFNKKGFTLVEIILAIALLGIISVSLISIFSSQLLIINRGTEITVDTFDNQGEFEEIIYATKDKIKANESLGTIPQWSMETVEVFGESVDLQKLSYFNLNRNNKLTAVYLSDRLALIEEKILLTVENVEIKVSTDPNNLVADLEVAPVLTASFNDNFSQNEFYTNLYRWYRTEPGVDPDVLSFPDDYVTIPVSQGTNSISNLIDTVGANSYVVLTVTPVDIHGYRGNPVISSNKVYIKGEEWRVGIFPWVDINNTYAYESDDYALKAESLKSLINAENPYPNPSIPEEMWDLKNGSLFIPMGTAPSSNLEPGNEPLIISGMDEINLLINRNINLAKDITVLNNTNFVMKAGQNLIGGNIYFHPYVKIDINGDPVINNGVSELLNSGITLEVQENVYLETLNAGSIFLYGKSEVKANNVFFLARGSIQINDSLIEVNNTISLDTSPDLQIANNRAIVLKDTIFNSSVDASRIHLNSPSGVLFKGGQWSGKQILTIPDGKTINFEKSSEKVMNLGDLDLSNTGEVSFTNSMVNALENPLKLIVDEKSSDTYELSTENYIRNIGYANPKSNIVFTSPQQWQNIGSGQNNIEFSISIISGPGQLDDVKFTFDGTDALEILKNKSTETSLTRVKIEFKDKYAQNNIVGIGAFNYSINSSGNITIGIEEVDDTLQAITIAQIEGVSVPLVDGVPSTVITETNEFTGTVTWSGNPTTFEGNIAYTAEINISPKSGYTLLGVPENFFKVAGAASVTHTINSGLVTALFPVDAVNSGLVLHLDAKNVSNGNVKIWQDESGKGNDAVEMKVNGIKNPKKNNSGYLEFNNDGLRIPVSGLELSEDMTVIAVLKPNDSGVWFRSIISQYPNSNSNSWGLGWMDGHKLGFYTRNKTNNSVTTYKAPIDFTTYENIILSARSSLFETKIRRDDLNGTQSSQTQESKNGRVYLDDSEDVIIGYHTSNQFGQMNLYEIIIFNRFLTDDELDLIYVELKDKYK